MIEAGNGPPNARAVASAVLGDPVDSQLCVHNNGFRNHDSFNLAGEMPTDHHTNLGTTDNDGCQFEPITNDANSINNIR